MPQNPVNDETLDLLNQATMELVALEPMKTWEDAARTVRKSVRIKFVGWEMAL